LLNLFRILLAPLQQKLFFSLLSVLNY